MPRDTGGLGISVTAVFFRSRPSQDSPRKEAVDGVRRPSPPHGDWQAAAAPCTPGQVGVTECDVTQDRRQRPGRSGVGRRPGSDPLGAATPAYGAAAATRSLRADGVLLAPGPVRCACQPSWDCVWSVLSILNVARLALKRFHKNPIKTIPLAHFRTSMGKKENKAEQSTVFGLLCFSNHNAHRSHQHVWNVNQEKCAHMQIDLKNCNTFYSFIFENDLFNISERAFDLLFAWMFTEKENSLQDFSYLLHESSDFPLKIKR